MVECDDYIAVKRASEGDEQAFTELVTKYQGRIANLLYRYIGSDVDIEDVVQEVFVKVYKGLHRFRYDCAFYTWLYRIALNTAKNHLLKLKKWRSHVDLEGINPDLSLQEGALIDDGTPDKMLEKEELKHSIEQAIGMLSEEMRVVLLLRELSGMDYEEIAAILECPVGTVRSRLFRAREFVSEAIEKQKRQA